MNRETLQHLREQIREYFLLEKAGRHLAAQSEAQRANIRMYYDAAQRRLAVARDLRGPDETPAAVALYQQGGLLMALAFMAKGASASELAELPAESVLDKFHDALADAGLQADPKLERVRQVLRASDPLEADRLAADEAAWRADELEQMTRWLESLVDPRSPRQLKVSRVLRLTTVAVVAIGCLVALVARAVAPPNVAYGKPATASSLSVFPNHLYPTYGSSPERAVDGKVDGHFGFHSDQEDSPWLAIDLAARYAITSARIQGRGDNTFDQSIPLAFEVSDDGIAYREVAQRTTPFSESDPWVIKPVDATARFVRLRTLRRGILAIGEVEVYGKKAR